MVSVELINDGKEDCLETPYDVSISPSLGGSDHCGGKIQLSRNFLGPGVRCFRLKGPTQPSQQHNTTSTALLYTLIDPSHLIRK